MHPTAARFSAAMVVRGIDIDVRTLSSSTQTAAMAAEVLGVHRGQIVKSLVFLRGDDPHLVLCAGDRRVNEARLELRSVDAQLVREVTGFGIGGIPPLGHRTRLPTTVDESLLRFETVWAAAGTPYDVFAVAPLTLIAAIPDAEVVSVV